jgi:hypothetical protein
MRYGVFSGCADSPADMRNANRSIDLWPSGSSDYRADMPKFNGYKALRRAAILTAEAIRARPLIELPNPRMCSSHATESPRVPDTRTPAR